MRWTWLPNHGATHAPSACAQQRVHDPPTLIEERTCPPNTTFWAFSDRLEKAAVDFTHNESCTAVITVDGTTVDPLGSHWHEGGYCDAYYDWRSTPAHDLDDRKSKTFCNEVKLRDFNTGERKMRTFCSSAAFYLDKKTQYTYTAEWSNGETTSGTFTTPDGGKRIPVCITNDGFECGANDSEEERRIESQTLEVDRNYVERANPGLEEYDPDRWRFVFHTKDLSVRNKTSLWIGHVTWGDYSYIRFFAPDGLAAKTYHLDEPEGVELQVVLSGDKHYAYDIDHWYLPEAESRGKVTIDTIDYETGRISITFEDVIVSMEVRAPHLPDQHMQFSGNVAGTFDLVELE